MEPTFFAAPAEFRAWLEAHHADERELLVGFSKKGSGRASITWPESVDQALCFGWIDGVRRSLGAEAYTIRFTPRTARSIWSLANVKRAAELIDEGLMRPAGLAAFEARTADRTGVYSFEREQPAELSHDLGRELAANAAAQAFFDAQPPGYRRTATHWVMSAKQESTRRRRMATLIEDSAAGRRIALLVSPGRKPKPK